MDNKELKISPELKEKVMRLGENDSVFIREFVNIFIKNTEKSLAQFKQYYNEKNKEEIRLIAHKLKSNFVLLELDHPKTICLQLEESDELQKMSILITELQHIIPQINKQLLFFQQK